MPSTTLPLWDPAVSSIQAYKHLTQSDTPDIRDQGAVCLSKTLLKAIPTARGALIKRPMELAARIELMRLRRLRTSIGMAISITGHRSARQVLLRQAQYL